MSRTNLRMDDSSHLLNSIGQIATPERCTDAETTEGMVEEVQRVEFNSNTPEGARVEDVLRDLREMRSRRNELFGAALFRDPAWDMLLELYEALVKGEELKVTALCNVAGVPQSTAFRHLSHLEKHGLVSRDPDQSDRRGSLVRLTPKAIGKLTTLFR